MSLIKSFKTITICSFFLLVLLNPAFAGDYSVTIANKLPSGATCNQVRLTYWSGGNGSQANSSSPLRGYSPQTLTIKSASSCSSVELQVSCRYFQTTYTNYGRLSQTAWSQWVNETKVQNIACGNHDASVDLVLADHGSVKITVLDIKVP
jgi:hypothetical protein